MAYAAVALVGAAVIALIQIVLSIAITQDSFRVAELTQQNRELTWQAQAASEAIAGSSSPQQLALRAAELGMVVDGSPSYIRLSDGAVIGAGTEAQGVSSVNPDRAGGIPNALLLPTSGAATEDTADNDVKPEEASGPAEPQLPPAAEGLPSPATR
ncbi:hypothetical protein [Microbacterium sp. YY-01]|uniref:hypothetical protein n=1 Tax=Microbacterium sp. YY-01 TaxID=3421634 RepID=UPI003D16D9D0